MSVALPVGVTATYFVADPRAGVLCGMPDRSPSSRFCSGSAPASHFANRIDFSAFSAMQPNGR